MNPNSSIFEFIVVTYMKRHKIDTVSQLTSFNIPSPVKHSESQKAVNYSSV